MEESSKSFLEGLSNELLANVFVHLDFKSALCFSHVNKQFTAFASDDTIWKYLYSYYSSQLDYNVDIQTNSNLTWRELCNKISLYQEWQCIGTDKLADEVWQAHFSPCGKMLAVSGKSGELRIYNVEIQTKEDGKRSASVKKMWTFLAHELSMWSIGNHCWSPDSTKIMLCDKDTKCVILDVMSKKVLNTFEIAMDTRPRFVSNDTIVTTTDRCTLNLIQFFDDGRHEVTHQKIIDTGIQDPEHNMLSTNSKYIALHMLHFRNFSKVYLLDAKFTEKDKVSSDTQRQTADSDSDGNDSDPDIDGYKLSDAKVVDTKGTRVAGFHFSHDDNYLAVIIRESKATPDLITQLWDLNSMTKIASWKTGVCEANFYVFPIVARGSAFIIVGSEDGCVSIVHTQSKELLCQFKAHDNLVNHVALHPELDLLVSVSDTFEIKFWTPKHGNVDITFV